MDLQSFIQSGLLEAYVLGQCSAEERTQVERMAAEHAAVRAELASIEAALEAYAAANAVQPPDWMKTRILEQIDQEASGSKPVESAKTNAGKGALRIFQILAFVLTAACSFLFLRQKDMRSELDQLRISKDSIQQQLIATQEQLKQPDPVAQLLCDPNTQRILVSDGKGISTIVYYNPYLKKMAYDPTGLPTPKPGSFYQFWAIVDGKPVSMGMKADNLCGSLQTVEQAVAFAISEENNPEGNPAPTTVLAIGKTS